MAAAAFVGSGFGVGLRYLGAGGSQASPTNEVAKDAAADSKSEKADGKADEPHKKKESKAKNGHGDKAEETAYFKFSRQFVAPVVIGGDPKAMLILDVMIELAPDAGDAIYAKEPKLRDAVLQALLAQSANGQLSEMLAKPELLEATRGAVLERVRNVIGDDAQSILLMDVGYQPY